MAAIPAEAHRGFIPEMGQQRRQIFLPFQIFEGDFHAQPAGLIHNFLEIFQSLGRGGMQIKSIKGMQHHNGHRLFRAIPQAGYKQLHGRSGFFAGIPQIPGPGAPGGVQRLEDHALPAGGGGQIGHIHALFPIGKKALEPRFPQKGNLAVIGQAQILMQFHAQFAFVHFLVPPALLSMFEYTTST